MFSHTKKEKKGYIYICEMMDVLMNSKRGIDSQVYVYQIATLYMLSMLELCQIYLNKAANCF